MSEDTLKKRLLWQKVIQFFIALGAFSGGFTLFLNTDGKGDADYLGLDVDMLDGTPFDDFLIPSLILIIVIGIGHCFGLFLTFKQNKKAGLVALLLGIILFGWLTIQIMMIGFHFLQPLHYAMALIEIFVSLQVRKLDQFD